MINQDTMYNVKNRSSSIVVYKIPEANLRREFAPGETKKLPFGELEKLIDNFKVTLQDELVSILILN